MRVCFPEVIPVTVRGDVVMSKITSAKYRFRKHDQIGAAAAEQDTEYGVGLGVVSQRPHEVSETVLAQCGTFLCLRLTNPDDQSYVRRLVPEAERDLVDILAGLGRGEAMALGEGVPLPTRLRFHRPDPAPSSDDVDFYEKWKSGPEDVNVDTIVDRWRRQER